jgi:hypothetical protein
MAEQPKKDEGEKVLVFHTGKGHGPMDTQFGVLNPGASLKVGKELAAKLCKAYHHIKLAADVIPGLTVDPKMIEENAKLKAEVKRLEAELAKREGAEKALLEQVEELRAAAAEKKGKGK